VASEVGETGIVASDSTCWQLLATVGIFELNGVTAGRVNGRRPPAQRSLAGDRQALEFLNVTALGRLSASLVADRRWAGLTSVDSACPMGDYQR
jgi:hypothetical protein